MHPDTGLGYPATYPGSVFTPPLNVVNPRDEKLLNLAWEAIINGGELVLDDAAIEKLRVGDPAVPLRPPPHVELAATILSESPQAIDEGRFECWVRPGRSAGTFTARLAELASFREPRSDLAAVYATVPTATHGAVAVQLVCPPLYAHAENICRVPQYLPLALVLGEHADSGEGGVITVDDLAVLATRDGRLCLVSRSLGRVIEPQAFHALAFEKQLPSLARFLLHLPRALSTSWHQFDWGSNVKLPFLPRVRYGRSVLAPARWRLTSTDLPNPAKLDPALAVGKWRRRHRCPTHVELADADQTLRLDLREPAHRYLLCEHLHQRGDAVLMESFDTASTHWIDRHPHEIVFPLRSLVDPQPAPSGTARPVLDTGHGVLPGAGEWVNAKVFTHPDRIDELLTSHLPALTTHLPDRAPWWFIRYRGQHETDHLRLRLATTAAGDPAAVVNAVGVWARGLRRDGLVSGLSFDTYYPERGRYWHMPTAEAVFVTDSALTLQQLRHLHDLDRDVLVVVNLIATAARMLGGYSAAMRWLIDTPAPTSQPVNRDRLNELCAALTAGIPESLPGWKETLNTTWRARNDALAAYHSHVPDSERLEVTESLVHMHHNRAIGVDRDREHACRKLARHAALAWWHRSTSGSTSARVHR